MDKKMQTLVKQYANSLLEVALEKDQLSDIKADIESIVTVFETTELQSALASFALSREDKVSLVRLLQESRSVYVNNFLEVMLQNEREDILYTTCKAFLEAVAVATNTHDIHVTTAVPLSDSQKERLLALAKQKLAITDGQLIEQVDDSIIGGFIINANSKVIDTSIRSQLRQFKQNLK